MPLTRKRGKYWYGFTRVDGVSSPERSTGCEDRAAAEKVVDGWERDAADPHSAAKRRATLDDALTAMLTQCRELRDARPPKMAKATVAFYEGKAAVVKTVFGMLVPPITHLAQIDRAALMSYQSARRATGLDEHTLAKELTTLRKALALARAKNEYTPHWDDLLPEGFSTGYEPDLTFVSPDGLNLLLGELLPDHAARAAFMVATSCEWGASVAALRADVGKDIVRVRGTKRATRDRGVPLVTSWQKQLVDYALEHAQGKDELLFRGSDPCAFNHALYRACAALEAQRCAAGALGAFLAWCANQSNAPAAAAFPRLSATDLRRTFGMWMRGQGVPVSEIALMMGHRDSRMAERVYARIPPELLRELLQSLVCPPAADGISATPANTAPMSRDLGANPAELAPRAGFEPATHGLTVRGGEWSSPRYDRVKQHPAKLTAERLPSGNAAAG